MQPVWMQPAQIVYGMPPQQQPPPQQQQQQWGQAPQMGGMMPQMGMPTMMPTPQPMMCAPPQPESWLAVASRGQWAQLDGKLACVSVGNDGAIWGTTADGAIFRRMPGQPWQSVPGSLVQVSCTSFDRAVGVNGGMMIFEWDGREWRHIPGGATWVSEGRDGAVFCCNPNGNAFRLNADRQNWTQLGGAGITQISVGDAEHVAAIAAGLAFRFTPHNNDWARIQSEGGLSRIAISAGGQRIVALAGGRALAFDGAASWTQVLAPPQLASIGVAAGGIVGATGASDIFFLQLPRM